MTTGEKKKNVNFYHIRLYYPDISQDKIGKKNLHINFFRFCISKIFLGNIFAASLEIEL